MPINGPSLPPHLLSKRKRDAGDDDSSSESSSDGEGPQPAEDAAKKRRVIGPAPPPAPLDQRPSADSSGDSESSGDDDDYGPSLPQTSSATGIAQQTSVFDSTSHVPKVEQPQGTKRDDWMMMPPTQDGLAARMDPTKLRARGFNTGKSAQTPKSDAASSASWFETPEQKRKRLQDEVLGVKASSASSDAPESFREKAKQAQDEEKARKIQKYNEEHRSRSLYEERKASSKKHEDDDPSQRAFNYEKDMSAAPRVSHVQKRELLKKAGDFGSRFSKGSFI